METNSFRSNDVSCTKNVLDSNIRTLYSSMKNILG